jgi:hypothetical protein
LGEVYLHAAAFPRLSYLGLHLVSTLTSSHLPLVLVEIAWIVTDTRLRVLIQPSRLDAEPSETMFRSPWEDKELFTVEAQNGRLLLFPGGIRKYTSNHSLDQSSAGMAWVNQAPGNCFERWLVMTGHATVPWVDKSHPRISIAFNVELVDPEWTKSQVSTNETNTFVLELRTSRAFSLVRLTE